MEWVKSNVGYYRHLPIATGSDALEVMFKRADALAGELGEEGFIPDAMLYLLCRRPAQAKKLATQLVNAGLWERVRGGYVISDWAAMNAELVKLTERKKRERDRKRAARAADRDVSAAPSAPASTDSPAPCPEDSLLDHKSKNQKKTAAAAAGPAGAAAAAMSPVLDVLRSKLRAHTALQALRFDALTVEKVTELEELVAIHGDDRLVTFALSTLGHPVPRHVGAFLGTWRALPPPGQPLMVVRQQYCPTHSTPLSPSGTCTSCASDQKAAR